MPAIKLRAIRSFIEFLFRADTSIKPYFFLTVNFLSVIKSSLVITRTVLHVGRILWSCTSGRLRGRQNRNGCQRVFRTTGFESAETDLIIRVRRVVSKHPRDSANRLVVDPSYDQRSSVISGAILHIYRSEPDSVGTRGTVSLRSVTFNPNCTAQTGQQICSPVYDRNIPFTNRIPISD